ncbi:hypothetical protein CkP1_0129 [Citrobacter phage CkP1]|nr:hypothetical protein CkP1_0129 [Citrobacter phage CkP1]
MHAFKDRAIERLDGKARSFLDSICLMQEFGTLRLDGGRQTGKTEAVAQFAADWLNEGNDVIVISTGAKQSREVTNYIKRKSKENMRIDSRSKGFCVHDTIRSFLSEDFNKYRGLSLTRLLIIIDEPMKIPDIKKFYEAYDYLANHCMCQGNKPLPLFFVIGMQ